MYLSGSPVITFPLPLEKTMDEDNETPEGATIYLSPPREMAVLVRRAGAQIVVRHITNPHDNRDQVLDEWVRWIVQMSAHRYEGWKGLPECWNDFVNAQRGFLRFIGKTCRTCRGVMSFCPRCRGRRKSADETVTLHRIRRAE